MQKIRTIILLLCVVLTSDLWAANRTEIKEGIELYRDGRWVDARLALLKAKDQIVASKHHDLEDIDFYLAMCAVELNDSQAEKYLDLFEHNYPTSTHLNKVRFAKAILYSSAQRYSEAKPLFATVNYSALTTKEREQYNIRMGYILFLEKEYETSREFLDRITAKSDIYHHALYYTSYIDYIQGNNTAARAGFEELLASDAYSPVAPFYTLQIDFNEGKYAEVLSDGEALYEMAAPRRQRELARSMAEAAFRLENFGDALDYLNRYRDLEGKMGREENYIMGFSLYREVRYTEAMSYLREACGADDALTQNASYHLADCYLREGDKNSASQSFAMAANENFSAEIAEDAMFNYAKLQYELGSDKFNETINTLARYLNKYPSPGKRFDEAKELLIASYYNSRNYDAAYKSINELDNPDSDIKLALQRIALYRGLESYNSGDYATATKQIKESLGVNISPKYSSIARFYLGEIEFAASEYLRALDNYNAYIVAAPKSDENYPLALYNMGYTKLMLGDENEALGYFQRYIEATPSDNAYRADAYNRCGDIYYSSRQFTQAKESYKRATWSREQPRYYALYQTAIIDGIIGEYDAKIDRLQSIIKVGEGSYIEPSMYELGRSYIAAGNYQSGVESHARFIVDFPSSDKYAQALSDMGLAYLNLNDRSTSLIYYDKAIKASPQSTVAKDALQGVREIYINDGNANGYFKYAASVGHSGDLSGMAKDSLSFASAQRIYINNTGETAASYTALEEYIAQYPQGYYTVDALFYLSDSYIKNDKNRDAITTLNQLAKRGSNQYSERVYDRLSSLSYSEKLYAESAAAYFELYKLSSKSDVRAKSLAGYVDATVMAKDDKATLKMVDFVLKESNVAAELLVQVKSAKAQILFANGKQYDALKIYKELSEDPHSEQGAEATYRLIEAEFNANNIDIAEQMVFDFAQSDTPQSYYLARTFIILGDIYALRGDNFQARATYQSIIDGYVGQGDNIIEQARAKIDKLQ